MTDRKANKRRLESRGFEHVSGWVTKAYAKQVNAQINFYREEVEAVIAEPPKPRGRPKRSAPATC